MSLRMRTYRGDELKRRVADATREAIDETTEDAAENARASHWWHARRGSSGLEGEIQNEPARLVSPTRTRGRVGTTAREGFYGLFLERRTPFLRPGADIAFPRLAKRIREKI